MFLLLNLWKKGIRDCFVDANTRNEKFNVEEVTKGESIRPLNQVSPFEQIEFTECQKLIRYALDIATEVKTEIPWEFEYWGAENSAER